MATIILSPEVLSVPENSQDGFVIATISVEGAQEGTTYTFALDETLDPSILNRFEIVDDELRVKNGGELFDFENDELNSFVISFRANANDDTFIQSDNITITVTDVNEYTPTDITVTGGTIAENSPIGAEVATLTAIDADAGDTFTYKLVTDASGATPLTNSPFVIDGNKIELQAPVDLSQSTTYILYVKVTDAADHSYIKPITVTVTNSAEVIDGSSKNDRKTGTADDDIISGFSGNDRLYGLAGNDSLNGGTGNDTLYGSAGNDTLNGGTGKDKLYGGDGQDVFVFDAPVKKGHFDHIEDFKASDDTIQISLAALKAFKVKGAKASDVSAKKSSDDKGKPDDKGGRPDKNPTKSVGFDKIFKKNQKLEKKFFNVGTKLSDSPDGSNDYIFYNKKSGIVYLDVDGSGSAKGIEILKVKPGTALTASDFLFI